MATTELRIAAHLSLPLDVVTEASAIVATRGAGKSSASAVIFEEAFAIGVQVVVFDRTGVYWGLRSNAKGDGPGLGVYVLGGPHGDVPLEPTAGALIADLVVDSAHSFVLDLSDFSKSAAIRFAADFLERLYDRKARVRVTTLLILDEAHFYAPQTPRGGFKGDSARLMGAMEDVVGLGRSRGIGVVLTTQRTQALNKAILDLIETLLVMRMLSPRARDAVQDWIREKHEDDREGVIATLDSLPTGTAWVWSPLRGLLQKVALRWIRTFDSYATPKPGQARVEPKARKELDLDALGEQMRATVERAKADDPSELRKRIRELERAYDELAKTHPVEPVVKEVEVEVPVPHVPAALREALEGTVTALRVNAEDWQRTLLGHVAVLEKALAEVHQAARSAVPRPSPERRAVPTAAPGLAPAPPRPEGAGRPGPAAHTNGELRLGRPERAILNVLGQFPPGRTKVQLAILTGYSIKSSSLDNALGKLRTHGLVSPAGVSPITITESGRAYADSDPLPTGRALLEHWLSQLGKAERIVLQALYDHEEVSDKQHLADLTARYPDAPPGGYSVTSSSLDNALGRLRSLELVQGLRVSDVLR